MEEYLKKKKRELVKEIERIKIMEDPNYLKVKLRKQHERAENEFIKSMEDPNYLEEKRRKQRERARERAGVKRIERGFRALEAKAIEAEARLLNL